MAYILSNTDGSRTITLPDGVVDQTTFSVALLGRNISNYGQYLAQNSIRMLENFASSTAPSPSTRLEGQLWYDKSESVIKVWDGQTWKRSTGIVVSSTRPNTGLAAGGAWLDSRDNKLKVYDGQAWRESSYGGQISTDYSAITSVGSPTKYGTRLRNIFLKDDAGVDRAVLAVTYSHDGGAQTVSTGVTSVPNQGRETIMMIISDHDEFAVGNFPSTTEGETVNYYQELVTDPDGIAYLTGPTLGKILPGINLRGAYRDTAISLASKAEVANIAMSLNTGVYDPLALSPTSIPAADVIHVGRGYVPNATGFDLGSSTYPFNQGFISTLRIGDTITGAVEVRNASIDFGNSTSRIRTVYANSLNLTSSITGVQTIATSGAPVSTEYVQSLYVADAAGAPGIFQIGTDGTRYRFPTAIGTAGQTLVVSTVSPNTLEFADANVNAASSNNQVFLGLTNSVTTTVTQAVSGGPSAINVTKLPYTLGKNNYITIIPRAGGPEITGGFDGSVHANLSINANTDWVAGSTASDIVARDSAGSFKANVITVRSIVLGGNTITGGVGINVSGQPAIMSGIVTLIAGSNVSLSQSGSGITISSTGGGGGGGSTNLSVTNSATFVTVNSDTGTDATITAASGSQAGVLTTTQFGNIFTSNIVSVNGIGATINNGITIGTGNVAESGGNLYFSNARVSSAITAGNGIAITVNSGISRINAEVNVAVTQSSTTVTLDNGTTGGLKNSIVIPAANATHAGVATAALYNAVLGSGAFTVNGVSNSLGNTVTITTTNIAEGANLYFSNARVRAAFANTTTATVTGTSPTSVNVLRVPGALGKDNYMYFANANGEVYTWTGSENANINIFAGSTNFPGMIVARDGAGSFAANVINCNLLVSTGDVIAFSSSDRILKSNLTVIDGALVMLDQLSGYEFDWVDGAPYAGHDYGVVAQEVHAVMPELVRVQESGYLGVRYDRLTALLIQAVKELREEVTALKDEVQDLRNRRSDR